MLTDRLCVVDNHLEARTHSLTSPVNKHFSTQLHDSRRVLDIRKNVGTQLMLEQLFLGFRQKLNQIGRAHS